ncbi:MAG TPA: hypothetical protein VKR60_04985 [Candidatus Sulfotelmatobacter sp.]|nr:hypothetical protein [Candidatus Sulfotelmatobacter sp.]
MPRKMPRKVYAKMPRGMCRPLFGFGRVLLLVALSAFTLSTGAGAATAKTHVITFGKWMPVKLLGANGDNQAQTLKVRPLMVDGRIKEYTLGSAHEVTERLVVVQRAFRLNDSLPEEPGAPHWQWQRGGWLLVDRSTGHVSAIHLAEFDSDYSVASWYRDYVAYCGVSEDGKKISAVVVQLSRRKPVLKKALAGDIRDDALPSAACPAPSWQRGPVRVSFEPADGAKQIFAIRGRAVDLVSDTEDDEEASK